MFSLSPTIISSQEANSSKGLLVDLSLASEALTPEDGVVTEVRIAAVEGRLST